MKGLGIALAIGGAMIVVIALMLDTTVSTGSTYGSGFAAPSEVNNIGLLQRQLLVFIGGCTVFVVGCVAAAAGQIVERLALVQVPASSTAIGMADTPAGEPAPRTPAAIEGSVWPVVIAFVGITVVVVVAVVIYAAVKGPTYS